MKKALRIAAVILRTIFWIVLAVVLLVTGVAIIIYSPWGQDYVRRQAIEYVNRQPGMYLELDTLSLRFPLRVGIGGMLMAVDGDTIVKVRTLNAVANPCPLFRGKVDIEEASLTDGYYRMGAPDSAMFMQIQAGAVDLKPTTVTLSNLDIDISEASMRHSTVSILLNPDTTVTPTDTTAQQTMKIKVTHLDTEDLTYRMAMLPTIDSLAANISHGTLDNLVVDLGAQTVNAKIFRADTVNAAYIAPNAEQIAVTPVVPPSDTPSKPWTIAIDSIALTNSRALYTTKGLTPLPGLDFGYIEVSDLDLTIADFYNQATTLRLPMRLSGTERCGLSLNATGEFILNESSMILKGFNINTPLTHLNVDGMMGIGDMTTDPLLPLRLNASGDIALADVRTMFPGYAAYMTMLPAAAVATAQVDLDGNPGHLNISDLRIALPGTASLSASGAIDNVFDPDRIAGDIAMRGNIINVKSIVNAIVDPSQGLTVPPMSLQGNVSYRPGVTKGNLKATTLGGDIALDGYYDANAEGYSIDLTTKKFPVNAFMADLGVGRATLKLKAHGRGFDLFNKATHADINASVASLEYNGYTYRGIDLKALISDGNADIDANVDTGDLMASLTAKGNLSGQTYTWTADIDGDHIDLFALKFSDTPATVSIDANADISLTPARNEITGRVNLSDLSYKTETADIDISDVFMHLLSNDSITTADIHNRDLSLSAYSPYNYAKITPMLTRAMEIMQKQIDERVIHVDTLQKTLPKFDIDLVCGNDNALTELLAASDMGLRHLSVCLANDSTIELNGKLLEFTTGSTRLDTISASLTQDGDKMHMLATINNRKGNMDDWAHITADGLINSDRISMRLTQQNSNLETGFDLGAIALFADSTITARMFPLNPVIGYRKWTVNLDNFLRYNFITHEIGANLKMKGEKSAIEIMSLSNEKSLAQTDSIQISAPLNDLLIKISDIHIADWIAVNPFAPPITGNLSADMRLNWDGGSNINGKGNINLTDFFYDNKKVASLEIDADVATSLSGTTRATADFIVDGERTMHIAGNLNDSTAGSPFNLDLTLVKFPLRTVNPFLPADMAQLYGTLNGEMLVSGDFNQPILNGVIYFSDTSVKAAMTNTSYKFSDVKIPVTDNVVTFNNFNIKGANENPLFVNGSVNIQSMTSPQIDLSLKARNMMLVNTKRAEKGATIFGKAYIDLDASLKGNMSFMKINADLDVLTGTNVSYILSFDTSDFSSVTDDDMVKFVNLNDTASVAAADSITEPSMLLNLEAQLNIQNGTTIVVELPTSSRDKVQLQPEGSLTYTLTPMSEDGRVTGRINLNGGFARYTLPVIGSEKSFNISSGSYVAFNGDLMNPVLNLHAVDPLKTNVTQDNQSRLVNFDIMLGVTGTLDQMNVKFDLEAPDDLSVTNELESMSAEQRANQAMNLLLYNMYTGPGTSGNANLSVNPLFSFLESQINNWAAQNIKGVDVSFNIDKYNQTSNGYTSSTMSYSYQVSKSMFNDRFKIVIGGNYTTDNNADESIAENLINDISFEYFLNDRQTMLVKLFRHVGFESILEGEITQTGVGFVYRRKINSMYQMIPKFIRPKYK